MSLNIEAVFLFIYKLLTEGTESIPQKAIMYWGTFTTISTFISLLLLVVIVYSLIRLSQVRREERSQFTPIVESEDSGEPEHLKYWQQIIDHVNSDNPNDWRAAVIDADKILEDFVKRLNLPGDTLGEQLKAVERSDFTTINQAWEAHKVRNKIAHESGHELNQREARRAIDMYRQVFEEFHYL